MTTPASLMVRAALGVSNEALFKFAADLAARLKATTVIGIGARPPIQIYASPDMYVPADLIKQDLEQIDRELKAAEKEFRTALAHAPRHKRLQLGLAQTFFAAGKFDGWPRLAQ